MHILGNTLLSKEIRYWSSSLMDMKMLFGLACASSI